MQIDQSFKKTGQEKKHNTTSSSKTALHQAMIKLMKSVPYSKITVTMIASDARINRKTFYAYYPNKDMLLSAILYEIFDDLFRCLIYKKEPPFNALDEAKLKRNMQIFLRKIICYKEILPALITDETSNITLSVADQVISRNCEDITVLNNADNTMTRKFYLEIIRNFFISIICVWIDSEKTSFDDAVEVLVHIMKCNADMFSYTKPIPE